MTESGAGGFVLLVDDDPDIREALETVLQLDGHPVVSAGDGNEALDQLRRDARRPCVILLDLMMPGMNGFELQEALSLEPAFARIPIVVITGAGVTVERMARSFTSEILRKPFDMDAVLGLVNRHCRPAA
jgi:two-component system, chemotaxis family, chemotaxis protein CheY